MNAGGRIAALTHPGPPSPSRLIAVATRADPVPVQVPGGIELLTALSRAAEALGVESAQVELLGGILRNVQYSLPQDCRDNTGRALVYSDIRTARGPVNLLSGSVTLGSLEGRPYLHCHAAWIDTAGVVQAGHVWPQTTIGPSPLAAVVHPLPGVSSRNAVDPETGMPVFTPYRSGPAGTTGCRVVLARVLPGEDLLRAASRMCAQADIRRASIRASLGSLVGPIFLEKEPTAPLPGPCAELVSLWGTVDGSRPVEPFHVIVGDATGAVHGGIIDPASSRVAVTVELLVTEESPP